MGQGADFPSIPSDRNENLSEIGFLKARENSFEIIQMYNKYVAPEFKLDAFNCPHCGAYAEQEWFFSAHLRGFAFSSQERIMIQDVAVSICQRCRHNAVWIEDLNSLAPVENLPPDFEGGSNFEAISPQRIVSQEPTKGRLIYPDISSSPMPHEDMPEDVKEDYLEARTIVQRSPRGAAALLRLCVQKLMPHLGESGKNINNDIGILVKKGLPVEAQQALDALRVIGNESVHPGQMALTDDVETATQLFDLLNFIVEDRIARPKKIASLYNTLPQSKRDGINQRDGKTSP